MDLLSPLFSRFSLSSRIFFTGTLCADVDIANTKGIGLLHVLRRGRLRVVQAGLASIEVSEPSLLFFKHPCAHRFETDREEGADLVCSHVDFGSGMGRSLLRGFPSALIVPLADIAGIESTLGLLFDEAFAQRAGREAAIDRLLEYCFVLLLRHAIDAKLIAGGVLSGLADPRLAKAMMVMHEQAEHPWSLESLAQTAGMSRARFAVHFRDTVGLTPLEYLTDWRISLAQNLLKQGKSLKAIAPAVGYTSQVAFTRVFSRRLGLSPAAWLAQKEA
jgi:AraC-like DNA-binding protein